MAISQISSSGVLRLVAAISFTVTLIVYDSLMIWHLDLKELHLDGHSTCCSSSTFLKTPAPVLLHCWNATHWRFLLFEFMLGHTLGVGSNCRICEQKLHLHRQLCWEKWKLMMFLVEQNMLQSHLCTFNRWDSCFGISEIFPSITLSRLVVQLQKHLQFLDFLQQDSTHSGASWDILESSNPQKTRPKISTHLGKMLQLLPLQPEIFVSWNKHESTANYHLFLSNRSSCWSQNHWTFVNRVLQKCPSCLVYVLIKGQCFKLQS